MPDFDPTELLETKIDGDALNDHFTPFPETECFGRIKKIAGRKVTVGGEDKLIAQFMFVTEDQHVIDETGLREPMVRYELWLDTDPATGRMLDKKDNPNANVALGRLKKACGIKDGKPFRIADLDGLGCYIKTKQDKRDEETFTKVVAVSAEAFRARS